ncbi:Homeodomain-like DNA binding domain-containing transcription factor [Mucor lusitanicus]|uniref:Homeodomain-like DNA binding domain-containing transcription factor n=1 Tax=Mucor lusitanicus CBS 277.49 TaxID=747725 RepID=A0A168QEB8_MUCCL|nr:Homeodomain-like DNA binding domain-containing transcription factor [Mucor lusitanicus CBS 277.49]
MSNPDKKSPNLSHLDHSSEENVVNSNNKRLRIKSHEVVNKPKRKRITPYQLTVLSDLFASTDTPNYQLRENTASKLNMTNREVQVWFQNRRAKVNRNRLQEQKKHDPFVYPICWTPPPDHHHQHHHPQTQTQQPSQQHHYPPQYLHHHHHDVAAPTAYQTEQQQRQHQDQYAVDVNQKLMNPPPNQNYSKMPFGEEHSTYDSQSSVTSSNSSTPTLYPQLSPQMRAIDILALAAEYVQRCDEEKRLTEERRKCWRPWD